MSQIAISFDFHGNHVKNHVGRIDPIGHLQMLTAAIDAANPLERHPVIVTAIDWSLWDCLESERQLGWEIYRRARIVTSYPRDPGHQLGAAWCLLMALEAAAAIGAEFLVHLADDVLLVTRTVEQMIDELGTAVYRGSSWGFDGTSNSQVFACRVAALHDRKSMSSIINPVEFGGNGLLEEYFWQKLHQHFDRSEIVIDPEWAAHKMYYHSHYPHQFLQRAGELAS